MPSSTPHDRRTPRPAALTAVASFLLLTVGACTGAIDGTGSSNGGNGPNGSPNGNPGKPGEGNGSVGPGPVGPGPTTPGPGGTGSGPAASGCEVTDPGPSPLRRLTRIEYDNTVRMLFGLEAQSKVAGALFPADEEQFGFDNSAEGRGLNGPLAEGYLKAAEQLAKQAAGGIGKAGSVLACDPAAKGDQACLDEFFAGFGLRAWRRPLEDAEKDNLKQMFDKGKAAGGTFAAGLDAVIQVMLLSPQFLYRDERGVAEPGKDYLRLTSWELASRLSYLLWGSMPDEALFTAAREGKLSTREEIEQQARRMLGDQRAIDMMKNFFGQVLELRQLEGLSKDEMAFPQWKDELPGLMRTETLSLVEHIIKEEGKADKLFTAPYTFVNGPLAAFYGMAGVTGDGYKKVDVDSKRSGILTQGAFLSSHATPNPGLTALIFRGKLVREQLLCQPLPDPPDDAADMSPPVTPTTTPRSWSQERMKIGACTGCHLMIDPIGYGFEGFNEIGLPRTGTVDTSGELSGADVAGPFNGPVELGKKLAGSKDARECVATQWFRFAHGRREDSKRDSCSLTGLKNAFERSGGDLKEVLVALTQTDAFLLRSKGEAQ